MKYQKTLKVFHLYRRNGTPLFLHPMGQPRFMLDLIRWLESGRSIEIVGTYGREPRIESLTLFRNRVYRLIERDVKLWAGEQRFIPRFLLSAGAFLITYFILSVVVRDPLPILDELLLALAVALGLFLFLGRKIHISDSATEKRIQLRELVDRIVFVEDPFLHEVEAHLLEREELNREALLKTLQAGEDPFTSNPSDGEVEELLKLLKEQFDKRFVHRFDQYLSRGKRGRLTFPLSLRKKLDIPLLSTYARLKEWSLKE